MFNQIDDEPELWSRVKESIEDRGLIATAVVVGLSLVLVAAVVGVVFLGTGWTATDPATATRVLQQAGYHDVRMTGYRWFACGDDDYFSTGFEATSSNGNRVSGTVCEGILKSNTIRLD